MEYWGYKMRLLEQGATLNYFSTRLREQGAVIWVTYRAGVVIIEHITTYLTEHGRKVETTRYECSLDWEQITETMREAIGSDFNPILLR